jgi:TIGR03009 family protein
MASVGLAVLLAAPLAAGQAPQPQPQQQKTMNPVLWEHLQAWERVMKGAANFVSEKGTKVEKDERLGSSKTYEAVIWCLKPNLARMRLDLVPPAGQRPDPAQFSTYICDGRAVYEYDGARSLLTEYPLGPNGGIGDNLLLEFMSGSISARDAAGRFVIDWQRPDDPNYLILDLTPVEPKDQAAFEKLTLVLIKPGLPPPLDRLAYLPRLAKLMKKNNTESESWDFPAPMINATKVKGQPITPADFQRVPPPPGWKVEKAGQARPPVPGPRVARPGSP